ncbi:zinc-dependent peptidase [Flavobacterium sp. SM15]|uniref:zinc-dependent peptidase n=1 Tax=Flavobacterium sp. SM15 TaxID=2908005 RepID=UPI001EDC7332|nr:zinc-dependent peptidase [Flavobacterium sp. SM15]MCG2610699.1 zinc-dependent peptidase [Flavobacterium sp. SM15]
MENILITVFVVVFIALLFFRVVEQGYIAFFNRPLYIHFYPFPKKLKRVQRKILRKQFAFYNTLTVKDKVYFEYRVAEFIDEYDFIGKEGLIVTDEMKVLVASTSTMLTFGMKHYLYDVFERIIIYPGEYYSTVNDEYHKGEFNPMVKAIAFSWKDFQEGYSIDNDNHNLGLHEFAHALNFQAMKSNNSSMTIFSDMFKEILQDIHHPPNAKRLVESDYFRIYAYTNKYEFLAVVLEHFFETPNRFKQEFPELFHKVELMINFKERR